MLPDDILKGTHHLGSILVKNAYFESNHKEMTDKPQRRNILLKKERGVCVFLQNVNVIKDKGSGNRG